MTTEIEAVPKCPLCGWGEQDEVLRERDENFPTAVVTLVRCRSCTFVFLNPRLTRDAMIALESRSPVYELDNSAVEAEIQARVQLLQSLPARRLGARMLDIGCNRGLLLQAAKRIGCSPVGVEVSPAAAALAKKAAKVPVYPDLAAVPTSEPFDLIVAWHVLEHTTGPLPLLRQARSLLAADGLLAIQVPSFDFLESFRGQGRLASIVCAVHNLYFTQTTLHDTIRRAGFNRLTLINSETDLMLTAFVGVSKSTYLLRRAAARLLS